MVSLSSLNSLLRWFSTLSGYRNLFHLGCLHRDISPGNIITVDAGARRNDSVGDIEAKYVLIVFAWSIIFISSPRSPSVSGGGTTGRRPNPNANYTIKKVSGPTRGLLIDVSLAIKRDRVKPALEENPGLTVMSSLLLAHRLILTSSTGDQDLYRHTLAQECRSSTFSSL